MEIKEIESLLSKITPGSWPDWSSEELRRQCWAYYDIHQDRTSISPLAIVPEDAAFIAQAPAIVRQLLREREEALNALDGLLDGLDSNADPERCGLAHEQWEKRIAEARRIMEERT